MNYEPLRRQRSQLAPVGLLLAALGATACGDSIAELQQVPEAPENSKLEAARAAAAAGSSQPFDSANAQVVSGGLGEPNSNPAAFVQGDSIVRDSVVVGHLRQSEEGGSPSLADYGLAPGHCLVLIYYYRDTGEIIGYSVIYCEPPEGGGGGGGSGSGGGEGTDPTDTTAVTIGLECASTVRRGETATCSITKNPGDATVTNVSWRFSNSDVTNTKQNGESWAGRAASSGTVTVTGSAGGNSFTLTKSVTVQDRGWRWPVTTRWASGSEVDGCMSWSGKSGVVKQANCGTEWFDEDGFSIVQGSGPWAGLYYVSNPDASLDLIAALHPRYRANGPSHPLVGHRTLVALCRSRYGPSVTRVNTYQANTQCQAVADFTRAISTIRAHEERHMNAGVSAARAEALYATWDAIVKTTRADAAREARQLGVSAHTRVNNAIHGTHTGRREIVRFWAFDSGLQQWGQGTVTLRH